MRLKLVFLAFALTCFIGCNNSGFKEGAGGLLYDIRIDKKSPEIKIGDFVSFNLVTKTEGDSVLFSTYKVGRPITLTLREPEKKGDFLSALQLLSEGDSATVKINIDSATKTGAPRLLASGKYIIYEVNIEKVIARTYLTSTEFKDKVTSYLEGQTNQLKKAEPVKIKKYIDDNALKVTTTPSGLNYLLTKEGTGPKPVTGDTVVINYIAKFLTGTVFDSNIESEIQKANLKAQPSNPYQPIRFTIGTKGMMPGWNEGLQLMSKGAKATFILPSSLAYGERGSPKVPGFTPLVFDIELLDVIHPDPSIPKKPLQQ